MAGIPGILLRVLFPSFFVSGAEVTAEDFLGVIHPAIGSALIAGAFLTINTLVAVWIARHDRPWTKDYEEHERYDEEHHPDRRRTDHRRKDDQEYESAE